jgi:uncharacterized NAD(P)/FAD-binding protein YdhS
LRATRELITRAAGEGHDWRDVIGGLRPITPRLWQQLDAKSRKQFVRHVGPYWDTHRHRAAPAIFRRIRAAADMGQLRVVQGRLLDIHANGDEAALVTWRARGARDTTTSSFSAVVNCTGPSSDLRKVSDPLIAQLRDAGSLQIDDLALGLAVDEKYRVLRANGDALKNIRYVGPLLKAQRWEATAVPELRVHAKHVADQLLSS